MEAEDNESEVPDPSRRHGDEGHAVPGGRDAEAREEVHGAAHDEAGDEAQIAKGSPSTPTLSSALEPLPLEVEAAGGEDEGAIASLDVCPNCGAPLRGADTLLCMRCGFDLKTMSVLETETGETTVATEKTDERSGEAVVRRMVGDPWVPLVVAMVVAAVLIAGYLAGDLGLLNVKESILVTNDAGELHVPWPERLTSLARFPVLVSLLVLCGLGALAAAAWMFGRPFGDLKVAVVRLVCIATLMRVVSFYGYRVTTVELLIENAVQALAFFLLSMLFFRLKPRDALTLLGLMALAFVLLYIISQLVTWATFAGA